MPHFFIEHQLKIGEIAYILGHDAHHIINVLRLKIGDWLIISDGCGKSFRAVIKKISSKKIEVAVMNEWKTFEKLSSVSLAFAVIKHDRTEYIIQKAVELGCIELIPFFSSRTVPKYKDSINPTKEMRWERIALEAAKQSGLPVKPVVNKSISFKTLCNNFTKYKNVFLFWEGEEKTDLKSICNEIVEPLLIIIGPEGGFSPDEIELAKRHKAMTVSLGKQILRVETAAIAALAIIQYEIGNLLLSKRL